MNSINLLLNVLFIIVPLYIYQIFIIDLKKFNQRYRNIFMTMLLSVSIILCLSFPVTYSEGFIFDLRQIPLIIGALYGGYFVAIPLYLVTLIYRFFIGGDGFFVNFLGITLILMVVPLLRNKYHLLKTKVKIMFNTVISIVSALIIVFFASLFIEIPMLAILNVAFPYIFIHGITIALITYLIEKMFENIRLQTKIQETERLQIVSQLAASVSHEVRNPLTVTKGFLQLLQNGNIPSEKKDDYIKLALSELNRAEAIITDYLSFARPKEKSSTLGDITKEVIDATNILGPYAVMNQVELVTEIEEECKQCTVKYDQHQFRQCLINIGKNAIEAMPNGGVLKFHVCCGDKNDVIINICDSGIGMSPEEVSKVCIPYYTTKEEGTGLGMMVVSEMINAMQGSLKIKSKKGEGTTFSISLPLSEFHNYLN